MSAQAAGQLRVGGVDETQAQFREIIDMISFTPIPRTPDFVKGVINLRGKVIPVIDRRLKFGMESQDYDERTCIVVDAVNEVTNAKEKEVEPTPPASA